MFCYSSETKVRDLQSSRMRIDYAKQQLMSEFNSGYLCGKLLIIFFKELFLWVYDVTISSTLALNTV